MEINRYELKRKLPRSIRIALVADLHDRNSELVRMALSAWRPDIIAIAGDLTNNTTEAMLPMGDFLRHCSGLAPTFYSLGNHEFGFDEDDARIVKDSGAVLLIDDYRALDGIFIGALRSRIRCRRIPRGCRSVSPHCGFLDEFERQPGFRILISHHPEYYEPFLKERDIDLILSGHAHGGQARLLNRGLFAPGQGLLPRYSKGIYDDRLIVSAGLSNTVPFVPRLFNPTELVFVDILKE